MFVKLMTCLSFSLLYFFFSSFCSSLFYQEVPMSLSGHNNLFIENSVSPPFNYNFRSKSLDKMYNFRSTWPHKLTPN